ncbi:Trk system potassium transporter TrkA [Oceanibacterium hippocampi]|uniref:Trk system potassium uptake protein TrkA n=1 Tax=Oceanibacterium hippocampi TaxID=745714 RepID=A0A1Y5T5W6_9PROT|nr:Trk system potassium transporter TrkA [Oceanibacterium hippocampi]SLN54684.1 Trk system potassium uptake protein TrkA [Oceanibacterium hippocampi]
MQVIICGAGQVGFSIARELVTEGNDVTVIDQDPQLVRTINDSLDAKGLVGSGSHPDVLERAGAADADMIIAVTYGDETNMVACQVAHSLFNVPIKVARIRAQPYLLPVWANLFSRDHLPIDVIISPEIEVAHTINRQIQVPGAFDIIPFAEDRIRVVGVRLDDNCPIINTPLRQLTELFPDLAIVVIGIYRNEKMIVPAGEDQMFPGDEVYFAVDTKHLNRAMPLFGHEEPEARRIVIIGGGNVGLFLASKIEQEHPSIKIRIIEARRERAEEIADQLSRTVVLHGDALDTDLLEEANIKAAETVVALTNDDEVNILSSLLAKRLGARTAITLVNKAVYQPLMGSLGIDVVVNPRATTVSSILQYVRRGRIRGLRSLRDGSAEVIEAEALETSTVVGKPLRDIALPRGIIIGGIVRDDVVIIPRGDTKIAPKDRVIIFALREQVKKVEEMFAVRLEFF